mmetsp:Transcript_11095/g.21406  ORF Transcript_11095/g.21406 Transcript_11095/m.21406 type:complete len:296 (-) Transcript_11095:530-1417(-)
MHRLHKTLSSVRNLLRQAQPGDVSGNITGGPAIAANGFRRISVLPARAQSSSFSAARKEWRRAFTSKIETQITPNENAKMFGTGSSSLIEGTDLTSHFYSEPGSCDDSPLAAKLLQIEGVQSVLIAQRHVTVTKAKDREWITLEEGIEKCILNHLDSGQPAVTAGPEEKKAERKAKEAGGGEGDDDLDDIIEDIRAIVETRVRASVMQDGGDVEFMRFNPNTGTVWLHLKGACDGCASSTVTLQGYILQCLQFYVPEVNAVKQCDANGEPLEGEEEEEEGEVNDYVGVSGSEKKT